MIRHPQNREAAVTDKKKVLLLQMRSKAVIAAQHADSCRV